MTADERRARLAARLPALMIVTKGSMLRHGNRQREIDDVVRDAVLGGATMVQLREKALGPVDLLAVGVRVRDAIAGRALLFVNGDLDAARTLAADGAHLPSDGPATHDVRSALGERMLVSRAVHSIEAAVQAEREGADMLVLGTVFPSRSHPGGPTIGVDGVRAACDAVTIPVMAIGGITAGNAADVMRAGASGVAVISAIFDADDARAAAAELRAAIDEA